jgi:cytochrome c biogenesis protein CcdA
MDLILGYLAGVLTLLNPCVLPILPIVLATALRQDKHGPLALAAGMSLTFVVLGVGLASVGPALGIDDQLMSRMAAVLMIAFGVVLLVPQFNEKFALATGSFSGSADAQLGKLEGSGWSGQFVTGLLLGAVWSPCIGPTLGGAISLAAQGQQIIWATLIMISFALGVSTIILALGYGTREAVLKRQNAMRGLADKAKPIMGVVLVAVGLMIFFRVHHKIDAFLINVLPDWFQNISIAF